jgi:DNA helicase II / ATP-dependent DNA helicase PcrA
MDKSLTETETIIEHISRKENFLLSGGAGSGKTYSLVEVIRKTFELQPKWKIAGITYTNVAAHEISKRVQHPNLRVSTIHDFLWDVIKSFQKHIKSSLLALIADGVIREPSGNPMTLHDFDGLNIQYKEWVRLRDGIISHDEVLSIASNMFATYPLLRLILADKFDVILVDEYQDTSPHVIEILLESIQASPRKSILGFFGDSMQSIYDDTGIGDLKTYVLSGLVKEVPKPENRRNPQPVIGLANKLRNDGLVQEPSSDPTAHNLAAHNLGVVGSINFLYTSSDDLDLEAIKGQPYFSDWSFSDNKNTKELYLTYNLIAPKAGFENLMHIYANNRIIDFKNDVLRIIKEGAIAIPETATFGEVIDLSKPPLIGVKKKFIEANPSLYQEARSYPFDVFRKIYLDKDQLIGDKIASEEEKRKKGVKTDELIQHLFRIEECVSLYREKRYNEFIRKTEYKILSIKDKETLRDNITHLDSMQGNTIEEVIDFADANGVCKKDDRLNMFISNKQYVYNRVKIVTYEEVRKLYQFCEGHTPFSTQHGIKGKEFRDVLIVLDNGGWNNYNFENLFTNAGTDSVINRTRKMFYVCCTRTERNLVVVYKNPKPAVIETAKQWFGAENVHEV